MGESNTTYHAGGPLAGRSFACAICGYSSQNLADVQTHLRNAHEVEDAVKLSHGEQGGLILSNSGEEPEVDLQKWLTDHTAPAAEYSPAIHYHVKASLEDAARNLVSVDPATWPDWLAFLLAELERQCPADCDFRDVLLRLRDVIDRQAGGNQ